MAFIGTPIGEKLEQALKTGAEADISVARTEILEAVERNDLRPESVVEAMKMGQNAKEWALVVALGEAVVAHDGPDRLPPMGRRMMAQALIEMGVLSGAECILNGLLAGDPGDQVDEAIGLLGRISKQRYINFRNRAELRRSIDYYLQAYRMEGSDRCWTGGEPAGPLAPGRSRRREASSGNAEGERDRRRADR